MQSFLISQNFTVVALLSALLGAVAMVLARTLSKGLRAQDILGTSFLTMAVVLLLTTPIFYHFQPTAGSIVLILGVALIDTAANYFYFKTFEKTEASVASPILSLAPFFTFLFSWLFLSDAVDAGTFLLSATIIILIIIIISADFKDFKNFKLVTLIPALFSSVLFGLSAVPSKYLLTNFQTINAPTLYMFRAGLITLLAMPLFKFKPSNISLKQYRVIFVRSLFVIAQWVLLYVALARGSAGVAVTLANITPIFVFIIGVVFLREKLTTKKAAAATLVLILSLFI